MAPRHAPTVTIQRSSVDLRQELGGTNEEEQPNTSRITRWLEQNGVPFNTTRLKKPRKSKESEDSGSTAKSSQLSITASNVTTMELEAHFNWSFQTSVDRVRINQKSSLDSILKVLNEISQLSESDFTSQGKAGSIGTMINLPSEWIEDTGSTPSDGSEAYWRQALLAWVATHDPNRSYINFLSTDKIKAAIYPNPNIFHMYNENYAGGGIAWTLTNALLSPTFNKPPNTEMEVEHLISNFLKGFMNVTECDTTSNAQLTFRKEITCFDSHSHPDFATRIKDGIILEERLQYDLYPATFFAEAKRKPLPKGTQNKQSGHLQVPSEKSSGYRYPDKNHPKFNPQKLPMAAQIAFAAYPSLVIIIAFLITQWRSKPKAKKPSRKDYQIPGWAVIYGIGYAGNGILVYAFFPHVIEWDEHNFPKQWGFMSVIVTTDFLNVFREDERSQRFNFIRFMLILQQHASRLKDHMKDLRLPEEFLD